MDRSWMYPENRVTQEYINGVDDFLLVARDDMMVKGHKFMCCPCYDCKNEKMFKDRTQIQDHLIRRGFVSKYTVDQSWRGAHKFSGWR
jgi:Transposase-associated domain